MSPKIVSRKDWLVARRELLAQEKAFTRARDALSAARREMPWVRVEEDYAFDTKDGRKTLGALFDGRSQLIVYHFMYGSDWEQGCKSCSFWADNFNGIDVHLAQRDVTFLAASRAPLARLEAFKKRMDWSFEWVSTAPSAFGRDFHVSFDADQFAEGQRPAYNYGQLPFDIDELVGISVFCRDEAGAVFHTYSAYSRGVDLLNGAYNYLDLTPKGRDEDGLSSPMAWVRHKDSY